MATVRIYRVAELLDTTSQEFCVLKKSKASLKSASSTIEESSPLVTELVGGAQHLACLCDMFAEHPWLRPRAAAQESSIAAKKAPTGEAGVRARPAGC